VGFAKIAIQLERPPHGSYGLGRQRLGRLKSVVEHDQIGLSQGDVGHGVAAIHPDRPLEVGDALLQAFHGPPVPEMPALEIGLVGAGAHNAGCGKQRLFRRS
jgi:hypothetical protein